MKVCCDQSPALRWASSLSCVAIAVALAALDHFRHNAQISRYLRAGSVVSLGAALLPHLGSRPTPPPADLDPIATRQNLEAHLETADAWETAAPAYQAYFDAVLGRSYAVIKREKGQGLAAAFIRREGDRAGECDPYQPTSQVELFAPYEAYSLLRTGWNRGRLWWKKPPLALEPLVNIYRPRYNQWCRDTAALRAAIRKADPAASDIGEDEGGEFRPFHEAEVHHWAGPFSFSYEDLTPEMTELDGWSVADALGKGEAEANCARKTAYALLASNLRVVNWRSDAGRITDTALAERVIGQGDPFFAPQKLVSHEGKCLCKKAIDGWREQNYHLLQAIPIEKKGLIKV